MLRVSFSKDTGAGLLFMLLGLAALYWGQELDFGTAAEMGPGFMPLVLGALIAGLGAITFARGVAKGRDQVGSVNLRPLLLILVSAVGFAVLVKPAGFVPALVAALLLAMLAHGGYSLRSTLAIVLILTLGSIAVFVYGLGLPFRLWWF